MSSMSAMPDLMGGAPTQQQQPSQAGSKPDQQFERDFADMATTYLQDRAPRLMPFLLGFQTLDRDDDGLRAAGAFGFKVGNKMLFVPTFFMNGELKGMDSIYISDEDLFVPFEEDWVDFLVGRQPFELGSPRDFQTYRPAGPDLRTYWGSPSVHKGSALLEPCRGMFATPRSQPDLLEKMVKTCGEGPIKALARAFVENPELWKAAEPLCPADRLRKLAAAAPSQPRSFQLHDYPTVDVVTSPNDRRVAFFDDAQREKLARGRPVVIDRRSRTKVAVSIDQTRFLENPTRAGRYEVFWNDGRMREAWVLSPSVSEGERASFLDLMIIVDSESKRFYVAYRNAIWVGKQLDIEDTKSAFGELPELSSIVVDNDEPAAMMPVAVGEKTKDPEETKFSILVGPNGDCTPPLRINDRFDYADGATRVNASPFWQWGDEFVGASLPANRSRQSAYWGRTSSSCDSNRMSFLLTDSESRMAHRVGEAWALPQTFRVLRVKQRVPSDMLAPGSYVDMEMMLSHHGEPLTMKFKDGAYWRRSGDGWETHSSDAMLCELLRRGLAEKGAEAVLQEVRETGAGRYYLLEDDRPVKAALSSPTIPDAPTGWDPVVGVEENYPFATVNPLEGQYPETYGLSDQTIHQLMSAARSGEKDIFDTAAIGGMVRSMNAESVVDKFLPDLQLGLDRVGRLLFMFYWHNNVFLERYGEDEMDSLEDALRSVFTGMGELVLFLKQRSIQHAAPTGSGDLDSIG